MTRLHFERLRNVLLCLAAVAILICIFSTSETTPSSGKGVRVAVAPAVITYLIYAWYILPVGFLLGAILSKENTSYWILGIFASPFIILVAGIIQLFNQTPIFINYATAAGGKTFMLAQNPGLGSNFTWSIWSPLGRTGFLWAMETNNMNQSEDGQFLSNPMLVPTEDGRRLLVRRGGIWTDCFEVEDELQYCNLPQLDWSNSSQKPDAWIGNSDAIAKFSGMPADAPDPGRPY